MSRKGFLVKVELDIQQITCPGVWLCSNGKVLLQIHMLDSSIQTSIFKPAFPIRCYEKFVFHKTFYNARRLNELQRSLNNEWFYAEFIQMQNCDDGCVLARFQTTLDDLLYPNSFRGSITGVDIDLLMEPTSLFPGTLAPKLEVSTKTIIEETLSDPNCNTANSEIANPKFLLSTHISQQRKSRPTRVCHSVGYNKILKKFPGKEKKLKPVFQYRKASDDLILRSNPNVVLKCDDAEIPVVKPVCRCYCNSRSRSMENIQKCSKLYSRRTSPEDIHKNCYITCNCKDCPVCSRYEGYFSTNSFKLKNCVDSCLCPKNKLADFCPYCQQNAKYYVRSSNISLYPSEESLKSDKKVCFCLPTGKASCLAQQLHEKLVRTLYNNRRFLDNCSVCQNVN